VGGTPLDPRCTTLLLAHNPLHGGSGSPFRRRQWLWPASLLAAWLYPTPPRFESAPAHSLREASPVRPGSALADECPICRPTLCTGPGSFERTALPAHNPPRTSPGTLYC